LGLRRAQIHSRERDKPMIRALLLNSRKTREMRLVLLLLLLLLLLLILFLLFLLLLLISKARIQRHLGPKRVPGEC
jgi:hypothetical protein